MGANAMVSIVIVTRNRKEDLMRSIESCFAQNYRPLEVIVYDDASTDGTQEAVRERFPEARYMREDPPVGHVVFRSRGFHDARGAYLFSIDDDAYFSDPDTVGRTVEMFESHPRAAAIGLPFCEPNRHTRRAVLVSKPGDKLRTFIGCAHALRVDVVRDAGCYRDFFFSYGAQERDLAIRLHDRGYDILYGDTAPIIHMVSAKRDLARMSYYTARNTLLFDFINLPMPHVVGRMAADAAQLFLYQLSFRTAPWRLYCVAGGLLAALKYARHRRPVSIATYKRFRSLPLHLPVPVASSPYPAEVSVSP